MSQESIEQAAREALARAMTIPIRDRLDVGESVGLYKVKDSGPQRLRLQISSTMALGLFVLGVAFAFLDVWLLETGAMHAVEHLPEWLKGAVIGLPVIGLFAILLMGRSFEFGRLAEGALGAGGVLIRKRWMWLFGAPIAPDRVAAVGVLVRPGYSSTQADRIQVRLLDPAGKTALEVADEASDGTARDVGAILTLAVQLGEVLGKPVRIEGEPKEMGEYPKDAIRRLREKLGASA